MARPSPRPRSTSIVDLAALEVRGDRRLVVIGQRQAFARAPDAAEADRELVAVGRLAGLADGHDHAAPVGVLAGDRGLDQRRVGDGQADPAGAFVADRAGHRRSSMNFCAPSPSRTTSWASWRQTSCSAAAKASAPGSSNEASGALPALPVAKASTVSLVEVSLSTVMQLKVSLVGGGQQLLQERRLDRRVGEDVAEHRRHVGRDHAAALDDAGRG